MKTNIKELFSVSVSDTEYFNDEQDKFELVSCPIKEKYCKKLRPDLNKDYQEAQLYRRDKMYQKSLDLLKIAYNNTYDLKEPACAGCAKFFRSTIEDSIENIKDEKRKRSAGLFKIKFPSVAFLKLENVLKEI